MLFRSGKCERPETWLDHEEESEVAEATTENRSIDKHAVSRRVEEDRVDDELLGRSRSDG